MSVDELTKNIDFGVIELSVIKIGAHDNTLCGRYSELIVKPGSDLYQVVHLQRAL